VIGLDTNVLVRYVTQDDSRQTPRAVALIERRCTESSPGFINGVVLCELAWVLDQALGYSRTQVTAVLEGLLRARQLRVERAEVVREAVQAYAMGAADFADALIAVTNRQAGCEATFTFDRRASRLPGMREMD
jgi:predicted nucleic-acid-binding protein